MVDVSSYRSWFISATSANIWCNCVTLEGFKIPQKSYYGTLLSPRGLVEVGLFTSRSFLFC